MEEIARNLLDIFEKRSVCQQAYDEEDFVDEDEEAESESLLIGAASDLVAALCEAIGEGFSSYFDVFLPLISKYYVCISRYPCLVGFSNSICFFRKRPRQLLNDPWPLAAWVNALPVSNQPLLRIQNDCCNFSSKEPRMKTKRSEATLHLHLVHWPHILRLTLARKCDGTTCSLSVMVD